MAAQGLETSKGTSEVSVGALSLYLANVMDPSVSYSSLEPQYSLGPPAFVDSGLISEGTILRDEFLIHDNSPRFLPKRKTQQSITYHGGTDGLFGYLQREELAGILGERIGSTADMTGTPERVSFGNSSSWEQYVGRIKFMCSFGGKILPRPGDGKLRYAGGDTRIITIDRHTKYSNLMHKMQHLYGQPILLKYQLPDEDLDALISVSCDEDVENMMEEYDRVHTIEGSSKLRIFLFSLSENDGNLTDVPDVRTTEEVYVDAINGMPETRPVGMVSIDSSNNLMGLEPIGIWNDRQPLINASTSLGIALQLKPVGMSQVNLQPLPRGFKTSPSNPSSPTITSRFSQLQQPAILDISHHMHPDQSVKGPPAHGVKPQLSAAYHDVSVKIGTSPLSSQHDAPIWPLESRKLADSPTKMQHENSANDFFQQKKDLISGPLVATGIPIGVMSYANSCGKVVNVHCHSKLMIPEENIRGIAMPPHQQFSSQLYSHVITSGHEIPVYNQLEVLPEWLNSSIQTSIHSSDTGVALSSPHIVIPESCQEMNAIQQHLPHQGDRNRWHIEQSHLNNVVQTQNELPVIGLKPLNTQIHLDEQLLSVEHATRQQHPIALMKVEKSHGNREGTCLEYHCPERLTQPKTPPYKGGSPCRESLSPFVDNKVIRVGGQGQMQHEDGPQYQEVLSPFVDIKLFGDENLQRQHEVVPQYQELLSPFVDNKVIGDGHGQISHEDRVDNSQYCEGVDWAMTKQNNEATSLVWNQNNQAERSDESNRLVSLINADDSNSLHGSNSSFSSYTTRIDTEQINAQVQINTTVTCVAENLSTLDGVKVLGSTQSPHANETFPSPLSASTVENSNLLFATKLEDMQWIKGMETGTQLKNSPGRNVFEVDPFSSDGLNRHPSSGQKYLQQEPLDFYVDDTDTKLNKKQMIDFQIQPTASISTPSQLSPRISADEVHSSSTIHCFAAEETTSSNYLIEGLTCLNDVQNKDSGAWIVTSETAGFLNLRKEVSVTSNLMAGKGDLPLFTSGRVQENTNEENGDGADGVPKSTDAKLDSSLLFSLETISKQDWEKTITTIQSQELKQTESPLDNKKKEVTVHSMANKVSEIKVDDESVDSDVDKSITHLHPAAIAEAKAIGRGLQTIKNADLEELRELGTGTFGTVYHGKWRGTDVAIKRIKSSCFTGRPSERERLIADFWNEAYMLGQLHHPNVVAFYGVVSDGPDGTLATVTEFMVNGSLRQVLQKKDRTIDRRKRLLIIMDAAFGMEYLHGKNIIHFDLKCENMLVNMKDLQRPICKVGDLGLSKVKHQTMVSGGVRGTLPWMAPELLNGSSSLVSDKVDVFSFGIVMWELLTGEEPYADMHYGAIIGGIVSNTLRPAIPNWCDPAWKALMERCWATDPTERPSFVEISAELRAMINFKS